ncbi:hypothetical protein GPALN_014346 [Globodera pallida]|nr:hypothetical protein GPALN_014346 [Globodera pallida]
MVDGQIEYNKAETCRRSQVRAKRVQVVGGPDEELKEKSDTYDIGNCLVRALLPRKEDTGTVLVFAADNGTVDEKHEQHTATALQQLSPDIVIGDQIDESTIN